MGTIIFQRLARRADATHSYPAVWNTEQDMLIINLG